MPKFNGIGLGSVMIFGFPTKSAITLGFRSTSFCALTCGVKGRVCPGPVSVSDLAQRRRGAICSLCCGTNQGRVLSGPRQCNGIIAHPMSHQRGCMGHYMKLPKSALRVVGNRIVVSNGTVRGPRGLRFGCFIRAANPCVARRVFHRLNVDGTSRELAPRKTNCRRKLVRLKLSKQGTRNKLGPICRLPLAGGVCSALSNGGGLINGVMVRPRRCSKRICPLGLGAR